MKGSA
jgi:hypothetical protein